MKGQHKGRRKWIIGLCILLILAGLGILGGFLIKHFFYEQAGAGVMTNLEANRLISYLGLGEYDYPDRLASSFTVKETKKLLDAAGVTYDKVDWEFIHMPGFVPITRKQFEQVYDSIVNELELGRLGSQDLYIYDIDNSKDKEIDGIVYELISTNAGDYYMEKEYGLDSSCIGKIVHVYVSNNEIILYMGDSEQAITIYNVYASKVTEEEGEPVLFAYVDGGAHKFAIHKKADLSTSMEAGLCDLQVSNEGIVKVENHSEELQTARVTAYADGLLTVDGYEESLYLSEAFNVYKIHGAFKASKSAGTLIGYEQVSLYIKDNCVEAALITEDIYEKDIRVLIGNSDYSSYYQDAVTITSDTDFTVSYGETVDEYKAGDKLQFRNGSEELVNGSARIEAKTEDGKIQIPSIERQCGIPAYRGTIELSKNDKGVIVINELSVEEYLYGVVPSEMPVTYEPEALKAQAICARAYAYRQMESENYAEYGAHLDDSISSQVYNNVLEDERAIFAVDDTYGVVPCYKNDVIEAFFFSTSCGTTSNNAAVWGGNQEPYLLDTMETELNDMAQLDNEDSFRAFINGELGTGFIEQDEAFFRWEVSFTKEQLTEAVNSHLYDRIKAMPEYILAMNAEGEYVKKDISTVGDVEKIEITKRGKSGIIEEMVITGTAETILVQGQSNARALFSPENVTIRKQDGSTVEGWTTLPSAYFYVDDTNGYTLYGGGFGHGVGMSQNGANDMAKLGYYASDIIAHYYTAVELKDMYELMGK